MSEARCPRCGGTFHCGAHDAAPCPCGTLVIDASLARQLRERYTGCLCLDCLAELQTQPAPASASDEKKPARR